MNSEENQCRNDKCRCGSGKKFKKCCGDVTKGNYKRIDEYRFGKRKPFTPMIREESPNKADLTEGKKVPIMNSRRVGGATTIALMTAIAIGGRCAGILGVNRNKW